MGDYVLRDHQNRWCGPGHEYAAQGPSTITFCATRGCALLWSTKVLLELLEPVRDEHPTLERVVVIGTPQRETDVSFSDWLSGQSAQLEAAATHRDDFCSLL